MMYWHPDKSTCRVYTRGTPTQKNRTRKRVLNRFRCQKENASESSALCSTENTETPLQCVQAERYKRALQHTENIFADSAALSGGRGEGMVRQSQTSPERAPAVAGAAQTGRGSRVGSRTERPRATAAGALQCPRRQPAWHAHTAGESAGGRWCTARLPCVGRTPARTANAFSQLIVLHQCTQKDAVMWRMKECAQFAERILSHR
ncbi:hypothetical protein V5799_024376 [Amblyomma americanum]|uniref:Uncharacterized protein n=1 Tax=Amblyomma americanum TaxID=6943 RepID=A0AAQ4EC68_AMBAM